MMIRSALYVALIALYVLPTLLMVYVALASKWSKKASEKYGVHTKEDMRIVLLSGLVPVFNLFEVYALVQYLWKRRKDVPLHPESK